MAALADAARAVVATVKGDPEPVKIPKHVEDQLRRGRDAKNEGSSNRRLCWKFWRDEHFWYVNEKNVLSALATITHINGGGKPPHRARTTRNLLRRIVEDKVSNSTRRTPGYDIAPATTDPEDAAAAGFSSRVALAGYEKWGIRRARVKVVTSAIVADGGFAMAYFDPNVGPFHEIDDPESPTGKRWVGEGEIKIATFDGDQVMWEQGCDFDDSPWWAIERARPISEVTAIPGYLGGKLTPDAETRDSATDRKTGDQVLVTEYFARPTAKEPQGAKLTIANGRVILEPEKYPCRNHKGEIQDEPILHRLSYTVDPGRDRDRGLVESLIDSQRTINDCWNKLIEWKNRCLNPQLLVPRGSNITRGTGDTPGAHIHYNPIGQAKPEWEQPPRIPQELFQLLQQAREDMMFIAAHAEVDIAPDVAARTAQTAIEQAQSSWAQFLTDLAAFDAGLMRHCLYLAARHYTEDRLMTIRGRFGWEPLPAFRGADLRGQSDVRVMPDSLEPITRQGRAQRAEFLVKNFPGQFTVEQAMAALDGGGADNLTRSYELDLARAHKVVNVLKAGPAQAMAMPKRWDAEAPDPQTGNPGTEVPGWMPRRTDNTGVWRAVVGDFIKTDEYDSLPIESHQMFDLLLEALDDIDMRKAMREAQLQTQMAEQQGLQNAAKPQGGAKPLPSQPGDTSAPPPAA